MVGLKRLAATNYYEIVAFLFVSALESLLFGSSLNPSSPFFPLYIHIAPLHRRIYRQFHAFSKGIDICIYIYSLYIYDKACIALYRFDRDRFVLDPPVKISVANIFMKFRLRKSRCKERKKKKKVEMSEHVRDCYRSTFVEKYETHATNTYFTRRNVCVCCVCLCMCCVCVCVFPQERKRGREK